MNPDILDAINEYYKLKLKYDTTKENEIKKYISDTGLSKKQKREKFSRFQPKCVNCNRVGGTVFSNKDRILKAVCKVSPPCKLDIQLQLGSYDKKPNIIKEYELYKDQDQTNIIKTKLNLLFNFLTEEETIKKFEEYKINFMEMNKIYNSLLTDYLLIIDNPTLKMNLNEGLISLYENVEELKDIHKEYNKDNKSEFLRDMVELYINKIHPNAERNRHLQFNYNSIEEKENTFCLVQKPYTLEQIEINFGENPKIIKNTR